MGGRTQREREVTGKAAAVIASSAESLRECVERGCRLICAGIDVDHVAAAHGRMREAFLKVAGRS